MAPATARPRTHAHAPLPSRPRARASRPPPPPPPRSPPPFPVAVTTAEAKKVSRRLRGCERRRRQEGRRDRDRYRGGRRKEHGRAKRRGEGGREGPELGLFDSLQLVSSFQQRKFRLGYISTASTRAKWHRPPARVWTGKEGREGTSATARAVTAGQGIKILSVVGYLPRSPAMILISPKARR